MRKIQYSQYDGSNAADNYRQLKRGKKPLVGPLIPLFDNIAAGLDIETLESAILRQIPDFIELSPLESCVEFEGVLHTRYSRFNAVFRCLRPEAL